MNSFFFLDEKVEEGWALRASGFFFHACYAVLLIETKDQEGQSQVLSAALGVVQSEEQTLPIGGDGWEKSKMKKKRSCIKLDVSPSTTLTKPVNTFQETKQGMQQRLATDSRFFQVFSDLERSVCRMVHRQVATIAWLEADSVCGCHSI
ncbi:hypothetical protein D0Y65_046435 [Glycine soja]|uniref:Uncharacterized protein n=1 Tax=Glycine soja TaxID=3848 RepID=A0A445G9A2_GLYSO|nr:hypothetical protein D0Y65_046435 [Glycine soja]